MCLSVNISVSSVEYVPGNAVFSPRVYASSALIDYCQRIFKSDGSTSLHSPQQCLSGGCSPCWPVLGVFHLLCFSHSRGI